MRFIRETAGASRSSCTCPFNAVHAPLQVPDEYKEPYAHLNEPRRTYAGMLAAMDEAVGQIVAALDEKGLRENTLFVFSSDNGGPAAGQGDRQRAVCARARARSTRAACASPRSPPGKAGSSPARSSTSRCTWWTGIPTLLKLAGAGLEQKLPLDGRDAWPTIAEGKPSPHDEILLNATPRTGAIRVGDWKLVLNGGDDEIGGHRGWQDKHRRAIAELFNLADDPYEKQNLAGQAPGQTRGAARPLRRARAEAVPPKIRARAADFKVPKVWGEQ